MSAENVRLHMGRFSAQHCFQIRMIQDPARNSVRDLVQDRRSSLFVSAPSVRLKCVLGKQVLTLFVVCDSDASQSFLEQ